MLKNIIFDIGGVFLKFNPETYIDSFNLGKEKTDDLNRIVFKNHFWKDYLRGRITVEEYIAAILQGNEKYQYEILTVNDMEIVKNKLQPIKETFYFLKKLKKEGKQIYVLSNLNIKVKEYFESLCDTKRYFNACVYSCDSGLLKPEKEAFETLLSKYKLQPQETLFIDDQIKNTEAAKDCGINTYLFSNPKESVAGIEKMIKESYEKV